MKHGRGSSASSLAEQVEFEAGERQLSNNSTWGTRISKRASSVAELEGKTGQRCCCCSRGAALAITKGAGVLLLVVVMIGACLAGFLSEERRKQDEFRQSVVDLGDMYAKDIQRQVRSSVSSARALEAMIKVDDKNLTMDNFEAIAQTLIETYGGISNLQIAPQGTVAKIHPLVSGSMDNRPAMGHALLIDPNRRKGALSTITKRDTTVTGPVRLLQGGVAVIARHPIFNRFAPEFLPSEQWTGKDGTVHSNDCATSVAQRANCYFPGPAATSDGSPTHFWGFATMLTVIGDLLGPVALSRLESGRNHIGGVNRFSYQLLASKPHSSMEDVQGIFAHSADMPPGKSMEEPAVVPVSLPELSMDFELRLAPHDGWPSTSGGFWVQVALLLPLTILVGVGMSFALLGNMHKTYTRARQFEQYRLKKFEQQVTTSVSELDRLRFPMCLMSMQTFEELGGLIPHEMARDEGRLRFVDTNEVMRQLRDNEGVVFISHQWSGFEEPDPQGVQYRAMVKAVKAIQQKGISCRWIWVDFMSIPQQNRTLQQNAIESLAVYVAHSSVFVSVTPFCRHAELGTVLDMGSYNRRGWCRLEQLSYLAASAGQDEPTAFACTETGLAPLWGEDGKSTSESALAVVEGAFTCCARGHPGGCPCDKTRIVGVLLGIYWRLKAWHRDAPNSCHRLWGILYQLEQDTDRFLPAVADYLTEKGTAQIEVFGDLVPVLKAMFAAESEFSPEQRIQVSPPLTTRPPNAAPSPDLQPGLPPDVEAPAELMQLDPPNAEEHGRELTELMTLEPTEELDCAGPKPNKTKMTL